MCIFSFISLSSNRQPKEKKRKNKKDRKNIWQQQFWPFSCPMSVRLNWIHSNEAKPIHLFPLIMRTIYYIKIFASLIRGAFGHLFLIFFLFCMFYLSKCINSNWAREREREKTTNFPFDAMRCAIIIRIYMCLSLMCVLFFLY